MLWWCMQSVIATNKLTTQLWGNNSGKAAIKCSTSGLEIWVKMDLLVTETYYKSSAPGSNLSVPTNMLSLAVIAATGVHFPNYKR